MFLIEQYSHCVFSPSLFLPFFICLFIVLHRFAPLIGNHRSFGGAFLWRVFVLRAGCRAKNNTKSKPNRTCVGVIATPRYQENLIEEDNHSPGFLTIGQKYSIAIGSTVVLPCKINETGNTLRK